MGISTADPSPDNFDALHEQRDWLLVTLSCIGDAVITTDLAGRVTFLNPVAEGLTGWTQEAVGQPLNSVIRIINEESRQPVEIPTVAALRENCTVKLASHSLLIGKDGTERSISDSAAPITNDRGEVAGVVLVFRDITERRKMERALAKALGYADDIIATLREPFVVLDSDLRVKSANRSFYDTFQVTKEETENRLVYDLGNGQWDISGLRKLLDEVLSRNQSVHDFEVEHSFPELGRKTMLLNARPFPPDSKHPELILLAVQDVSALRARADELAEASRHKDEFLATLAHELRNPLSPIRNSVHYLGLDGLTERDVKSARDVITRQVAIMVRLIDDLLDVSRISRNRLDVRKERVELAAVVSGHSGGMIACSSLKAWASPSSPSDSRASLAWRWSMCRLVSPTELPNVLCSFNRAFKCTNHCQESTVLSRTRLPSDGSASDKPASCGKCFKARQRHVSHL